MKRGKINIADNGCWLWTGSRNQLGYPRARVNGGHELLHRLFFKLFTGANIPKGIYVCHKCDTPSCVNPKHLFLGSALDNARDRDSKGRLIVYKGEKHWKAKLTTQNVKDIRASVLPTTELLKKYSVGRGTINKIRRGDSWQ